MHKELSDKNIELIKQHLNRSTSAMFILGNGVNWKKELSWEDKEFRELYSDDEGIVKERWSSLLKKYTRRTRVPFISEFVRYVSATAPIDLAKFRILNTNVLLELGPVSKNTIIINQNGLLHDAPMKYTGKLTRLHANSNLEDLIPPFIPQTLNYKPIARDIEHFEEFMKDSNLRSVFFLGTSGSCPIVESLFNRSLLRTLERDPIFKCVVNTEPTYLDTEADMVFRMEPLEFLKAMDQHYIELHNYNP